MQISLCKRLSQNIQEGDVRMKRSLLIMSLASLVMGLQPARAAHPARMPMGKEFANSIGMKFIRIKPGTFTMGYEGELPDHIKKAKEFSGNKDVWLPGNGDYDERRFIWASPKSPTPSLSNLTASISIYEARRLFQSTTMKPLFS
jgi:hypothetical protein